MKSRYALQIAKTIRTRLGRCLLVCVVVAGAAFFVAPGQAGRPVVRLGTGADEVWVLRPRGNPTSVVVFGHGWSTPFPVGFGPWIAHLRARGSIVIYPRYRVGANDSTSSALAAFRAGVVRAFKVVGRLHVPVVTIGKSFGGSAVFYYAASARSWGVPAPAAVMSVFPALPLGGLPVGHVPAKTYVEVLVGDADTTAGSAGADAFWRWLGGRPGPRRSYVVVRSRHGFVANHDSAQRSDAIARSVFWRPLDVLIERTRSQLRK